MSVFFSLFILLPFCDFPLQPPLPLSAPVWPRPSLSRGGGWRSGVSGARESRNTCIIVCAEGLGAASRPHSRTGAWVCLKWGWQLCKKVLLWCKFGSSDFCLFRLFLFWISGVHFVCFSIVIKWFTIDIAQLWTLIIALNAALILLVVAGWSRVN